MLASCDSVIVGRRLTAIDIALEPDAVMMNRALADNAALRANVPQGFALDATHHAHVTLLQCFVRTADLPTIYAATEEILARKTTPTGN